MSMEQKIDKILDHFDFEAVHAHMKAVNWGWGHKNRIPTPLELYKRAKKLLVEVMNSTQETGRISTGGFHAIKWPWGELELIFEVDSWDTEI